MNGGKTIDTETRERERAGEGRIKKSEEADKRSEGELFEVGPLDEDRWLFFGSSNAQLDLFGLGTFQ